MSTSDKLETLVENIFVDDQIGSPQLKEFLKVISARISPLGDTARESVEDDRPSQVNYLAELITTCEDRLERLGETPKTKIVIRNEGEKLQTIMDTLECVQEKHNSLQSKINSLVLSHEKLRKLECLNSRKFQDMSDCMKQSSVNTDLCSLRRMYYSVANQADELVVRCLSMEGDISAIQERIEILERIPQLEGKVNMLLDWRASLREEFNLFAERYEHVKTVKANKCELEEALKEKVSYSHLAKYVHRLEFEAAKDKFVKEFEEMKDLFCELQKFFSAKLVALHKDLQMVLTKLASKRRLEKRS